MKKGTPPNTPAPSRRQFLLGSAAVCAAAAAGTAFGPYVAYAADAKPLRVGLIGSGWYGKSDLLRLIQVAPVEVVSLCDVDRKMLGGGGRAGRHPAGVEEEAADVPRLPRDAQGEGPGRGADRHARPLARADRSWRRWRPGATSTSRSRSAWTWGRARPCSPPPASTSAWCRSARSGAARRTSSRRATASSRRASSARSGWSRSTATTTCATTATRRTPTRRPTSTGTCTPAPPPCARTTRSCTPAAGAASTSTATASSATCASTCST